MHYSKEYSNNSNTLSGNKTRQTFRSRAYTTNNKVSKNSKVGRENEVRVFKLMSLKDGTRGYGLTGEDELFKRTMKENSKGFIRFGGSGVGWKKEEWQ